MLSSSNLEKLTIQAYTDSTLSIMVESPYSIMINSDYSVSETLPKTLTVKFNFDTTNSNEEVSKEVEVFKSITYNYNGEVHSPNYLKLSIGELIFNGRLASFNLTYTGFKPDGTPLKAIGLATFSA